MATKNESGLSSKSGSIYAMMAFLTWGFSPIYWKQLAQLSPVVITSHRVIWAALLFFIFFFRRVRKDDLWAPFRSTRLTVQISLMTVLSGLNILIFVWAVIADKTLEASFGYFLCPLVKVLLGTFFLREKLSTADKIGSVFAAVGVSLYAFHYNHLPWMAFSLAASFAGYGLLKKTTQLQPIVGLAIENVLLAIPALACMTFYAEHFVPHVQQTSALMIALLVGGGAVHVCPLLWYAKAAKSLPLARLGILQYIAPTCQFLVAVFVYHESFSMLSLVSFGFIWIALIISSLGAYFANSAQVAAKRPTEGLIESERSTPASVESISDTARWIAACRALGSELPETPIKDPFARMLAGERGFEIARDLKTNSDFIGTIIIRTLVIDQMIVKAIVDRNIDTVVNLAAGLDSRPFRLSVDRNVRWIDIDLPAILKYKAEILSTAKTEFRYEAVHLDLADREERRKVFRRIGAASQKTLILAEGFLVYLTSEQVEDLATDLHLISPARFWLAQIISPFQLNKLTNAMGEKLARGGAKLRFSPPGGPAYFVGQGWQPTQYRSLYDAGKELNIRVSCPWFVRLIQLFAPKKIRSIFRFQAGGVALLSSNLVPIESMNRQSDDSTDQVRNTQR